MRGSPATVVILSEHGLFRQCAASVLREKGFTIATKPTKGDVVAIVDLDHTETDSPTLLRKMTDELGTDSVVAVGQPARLAAATVAEQPSMIETSLLDGTSLAAAARSRASKTSPHIERQRRSWAQVTTRQRDVLRWLALGYDNAAIGARLRVGIRAIKAHISALLELFSLENRTQLALLARDAGLRPVKAR